MDSAVNVEWEPMTELERRVEDGIHYEHILSYYSSPSDEYTNRKRSTTRTEGSNKNNVDVTDDDASTQGVFCGYRYSQEEYNRLKSAEIIE
jgi:hypothetical protein